MTWRLRLEPLLRDARGAVLVEFAIIGPVFIGLLFGVLQVAAWMQNYNAVRSAASDAARKVLVQYQRNNELNQSQIESLVVSTAVNAPYFLHSDGLTVAAANAGTQRVTGAREINLQIDYTPEIFLPLVHINSFTVRYNRPIFVVDPT